MFVCLRDLDIGIRVVQTPIASTIINNILLSKQDTHVGRPSLSLNWRNVFNSINEAMTGIIAITHLFALINCHIIFILSIGINSITFVVHASFWEMDVVKSYLMTIVKADFNEFILAIRTVTVQLGIIDGTPFLLFPKEWILPVCLQSSNISRCIIFSPRSPIC